MDRKPGDIESEAPAIYAPVFDIVKMPPISLEDATSCGMNVAKVINKKRFLRKRLSQEEEAAVAKVFTKAVIKNSRIPCILLWGIGTKQDSACWEEDALQQLMRLDRAVKTEWPPGLIFHVVFADIHARVNRIPEKTVQAYFENMSVLLSRHRSLKTLRARLSQLWHSMDKHEYDIERIKKTISPAKTDPSFEFIHKNAEKNYHGYDVIDGALKYMATRLIDKDVLARRYCGCVYLTYNNPKTTSFLQPDLPVLYAWSIRKGTNRSPWFMPNEACP